MSTPARRLPSLSSTGLRDALGRRRLTFDREAGRTLERLHVRPEFAVFEQRLRERVATLSKVDDERLARVQGVEHDPSTGEVVVVSAFVEGWRVGEILEVSACEGPAPGLDAALGLLQEILPALHTLHVRAGFAHGVLAPERVAIREDGRVVLLDATFGEAVEQLRFSRARLWDEFGVVAPVTPGPPRLDKAGDLRQASLTALMLLLGRAVGPEDLTQSADALMSEVRDIAQIRASAEFAAGLVEFFARSLPLRSHSAYGSAEQAVVEVRQLVRRELGVEVCRRALIDAVQQADAFATRAPATTPAARTRTSAGPLRPAVPPPPAPAAPAVRPSPSPALVVARPAAAPAASTPQVRSPSPADAGPVPSRPSTTPRAVPAAAAAATPPVAPPATPPLERQQTRAPEPPAVTKPAPPHARDVSLLAGSPGIAPAPAAPAATPAVPAAPVTEPEPLAKQPVAPQPVRPPEEVPPPVAASQGRSGRKKRRRSSQPPASAPAAPVPPAQGWLVPPDRAAEFEPAVQQAGPMPAAASRPPVAPPPPPAFPVWSAPSPTPLASSSAQPSAPPFAGAAPAPMPTPPAVSVVVPGALGLDKSPRVFVPLRLKSESGRPARHRSPWADDWQALSVTGAPTGEGVPPPPRTSRLLFWAAGVVVVLIAVAAGRAYFPAHLLPGRSSAAPGPVAEHPIAPATPATSAPAARAGTGELKIEALPAGTRVLLNGTAAGQAPLTIPGVAPGRHTLTFISPSGGTLRRAVQVDAGESVAVTVQVFSGWLAVFAPITLDVSSSGRSLGNTEQGRLMIPPGRHELTLSNRVLGYQSTHVVEIEPGEVRTLTLEPQGGVNLNALPWAEVWIDGQKRGETPLANLQVPLGVREIVFRHPELGERRVNATITASAPAVITVDLTRP